MGVNDDWSFEKEFCSINDVPVTVYDASVNKLIFLKRVIKSLFRIDKPKLFFYWFNVLLDYISFFKGNKRHIEKFVGLNFEAIHCDMRYVFENEEAQNIFLKIDIEGSEYRILDELISNSHRISGVVIEFHDCDIHLERIKSFINDFNMRLIHIHANNYAPVSEEAKIPLVMELTFSANSKQGDSVELPHEFDMPNNKDVEEIVLSFKN